MNKIWHIVWYLLMMLSLSPSVFAASAVTEHCDLAVVKREMGEQYPKEYMDIIFTGTPPFDRLYTVELTDWYWKKMGRGDLQPSLVLGNPQNYDQTMLPGLYVGRTFPQIQQPLQINVGKFEASEQKEMMVQKYQNPYTSQDLDKLLDAIWGAETLKHPLFKIRFIAIFEIARSKKQSVKQ